MAGALGSLGLQAARGLGSSNQQGQSQVRRDQSLIDSQIATGNQVTSGVDVDALTRIQPQSIEEEMNLDIDLGEQEQPVFEEIGNMGAVTGNQAMSAFPGKGMMPFVDIQAEPNFYEQYVKNQRWNKDKLLEWYEENK